MPDASRPRNDGQSASLGGMRRSGPFEAGPAVLTIDRAGAAAFVPGGDHLLRSRIIVRARQSSDTTSRPSVVPSTLKRYFAAPSHFDGPGSFCSVISLPLIVHRPVIGGHPGSPPSVNVPAGSSCSRKSRIASGPVGTAGWASDKDDRAKRTARVSMTRNYRRESCLAPAAVVIYFGGAAGCRADEGGTMPCRRIYMVMVP